MTYSDSDALAGRGCAVKPEQLIAQPAPSHRVGGRHGPLHLTRRYGRSRLLKLHGGAAREAEARHLDEF